MKTNSIQYRATCPVCFRDHAIRVESLCMVPHGYQRPEGWHQNINECEGVNSKHFGTVEGRLIAKAIAERALRWANSRNKTAKDLKRGNVVKLHVQAVGFTRHNPEYIDITPAHPRWERELQRAIYAAESDFKSGSASHADIMKRVTEWKKTAPRAVPVVGKVPTLHWSGGYWKNGKACAGSAMGAQKGDVTKDEAKVNCAKCLVLIESTKLRAEGFVVVDALYKGKYGTIPASGITPEMLRLTIMTRTQPVKIIWRGEMETGQFDPKQALMRAAQRALKKLKQGVPVGTHHK